MALKSFASILLLALPIAGCYQDPTRDPGYAAACHGPLLRGVAAIEKARVDGYDVLMGWPCISKASWEAMEVEKARLAAYNAPEARARREAEAAEQAKRAAAEREERLAREAAQEQADRAEREAALKARIASLRPVEINTASEEQLIKVPAVHRSVAAEIVAARTQGRFRDWADVVHRVMGLSQAHTAALASLGGLQVNGKGLEGAKFDPMLAAHVEASRGGKR